MKYNKKSSPSPSVSISPSASVSYSISPSPSESMSPSPSESISPSPSPEPIQTSKDFEIYDIVYSKTSKCHFAILSASFKKHGKFLVQVCDKYDTFFETVENLKLVSTACKTHDEAIATIQAMDKLTNREEQ